MKKVFLLFSAFIFFSTVAEETPEGVKFTLPPPPELKIPPDEYHVDSIGLSLHPNIEKRISQEGKWPIYYVREITAGRTQEYKYLMIQLGVFDGHFGHFTLVVRDKIKNSGWEEIELFDATLEMKKVFEYQNMGYWMNDFRGNIDTICNDLLNKQK